MKNSIISALFAILILSCSCHKDPETSNSSNNYSSSFSFKIDGTDPTDMTLREATFLNILKTLTFEARTSDYSKRLRIDISKYDKKNGYYLADLTYEKGDLTYVSIGDTLFVESYSSTHIKGYCKDVIVKRSLLNSTGVHITDIKFDMKLEEI